MLSLMTIASSEWQLLMRAICYRQDVMSAKRRHIVSERRDKMAEETV